LRFAQIAAAGFVCGQRAYGDSSDNGDRASNGMLMAGSAAARCDGDVRPRSSFDGHFCLSVTTKFFTMFSRTPEAET
jgi:hypothetical protein